MMNRPVYTEFKGNNKDSFEIHLVNYIDELNKYCDELEKALDKACEDIATYIIKDVDKGEIVYMQLHILKEKYKSEYLSESEKE